MAAKVSGRAVKFGRFATAGLAMLAAGCAHPPGAAPDTCLLPAQSPMVTAKLYFGDAIEGRPPLTQAEWGRFVADIVTPRFPDGFTTYRASGQWRSKLTGGTATEATHVIEIVAPPEPGLGAKLDSVAKAYRSRFAQESVGIVTSAACATF